MKKESKFTLITFNAQGVPSFRSSTLFRFRKIGALLNKTDADIINLQEVFTYKQISILKSELTNFQYFVYEKSMLGPKGGLVTFSKKRIKKMYYISYSYPFELLFDFLKNGWIRVILRNLLSGKGILISKTIDDGVYIANTHLIANPTGDWSELGRFSNIYTTCIKTLKGVLVPLKSDFVLLTGDFNFPKTSYLYTDLISKLNLKDLFEDEESPTFRKEFLPHGVKGSRLDFILMKQNSLHSLSVKKHTLFAKREISIKNNKGFLSDHLGLRIDIKMV